MQVELDKAASDHVFGRVTFEARDREWLKMSHPWRALAHALLAFEMRIRRLGKVPAHLEGYVSRTGVVFVECWRFREDGIETPSFLKWNSEAAEPCEIS